MTIEIEQQPVSRTEMGNLRLRHVEQTEYRHEKAPKAFERGMGASALDPNGNVIPNSDHWKQDPNLAVQFWPQSA